MLRGKPKTPAWAQRATQLQLLAGQLAGPLLFAPAYPLFLFFSTALPAGEPPVPERDFDSAVPVRVRVEGVNSLNNRFKVDPLIRTRSVRWGWSLCTLPAAAC